MTTALITGITGQDGSYLAELLEHRGYTVHGTVRRHQQVTPTRHLCDLTDTASVDKVVDEVRPDEIYHLGAQTHVGESFKSPIATFDATGAATLRLLEAVRRIAPQARFYQAATSELFGISPAPQSESTPFHPRSPYGVAKLAAYWAVVNYREAYGLHASNGILFNHESPRRGAGFVTRKISLAVAAIKRGDADTVTLGNLDARRDWGFAPEYVDGMHRILQHAPGDYILATGTSYSVRDFAEHAFAAADLDWADHVRTAEAQQRPADVPDLVGDSSRARDELGWVPTIHTPELARIMVTADMAA
ncbi:GDP-mannose 4,6-dehydratase [Microbacterium sp. 2FI]|uniref:GDP-mannose 4,6-dehydratase n=1 Tax=Microbacterium sp. 2FI TaxID=2502193 RepID=UPI0010F98AE6|nr:GDP-mannose 4,6-dehydratase [Microbacterium sp. 2FI]